MKFFILYFIFWLGVWGANAQSPRAPISVKDKRTIEALGDSAEHYFRKHNFEKTQDFAQKALTLSQKHDYPDGAARAIQWLSTAFLTYGKAQEALALFEKYQPSLVRARPERGARAYMEKAMAYADLGNYPQSLHISQKSVTLLKQAGLVYEANRFQLERIQTLINVGRCDEAIREARPILSYFQTQNDRFNISIALLNIGLAYDKLESYSAAMEYYLASYKNADLLKKYNFISFTILAYKISIIYTDLNQLNRAQYYLNALEAFLNSTRTLSEPRTALNAEVMLNQGRARYYRKTGGIQKEEKCLLKNLAIEKTMGIPFNIHISHYNIAEFYYAHRDYKKSRAHCDTLLRYAIATEQLTMEVSARSLLAQSALKMHELAQAQNERLPLLKILPDVLELEFRNDGFQALAEIDSAAGNFRSAYAFKRQAEALQDSLYNETLHENIAKIETRFELENEFAEQKRAQIIAKTQENAAKNARNERQFLGITVGLLTLFSIGVVLRRRTLTKQNFTNFEKGAGVLIFCALLLTYEFILIFVSPYISLLTGDVPFYKLACNVGVVAVIAPFFQLLRRKFMS